MDPEEIRDLQNFYHGVGFAACQKYLSSATRQMKITRSDALNLGPKHSTEGPIVALVNAIANYWKHQDEWDLKPTQRGRKETIDRPLR